MLMPSTIETSSTLPSLVNDGYENEHSDSENNDKNNSTMKGENINKKLLYIY